ncbi:aspartyl-tRNA synthetase [Cyclonatronum proteinivorum]|uniref:Aspartate--tRNA ligase n=1 Tax=Cyclonatronum proteinivorum TaxID=1457365 RepID=A0A345UPY6_9BACT|nr:aspartate--tRNA ligase [Cyclonatronum proteinivorum]AXJ02538.1 aspartyl-tRNA synthetase [Cyclonatronum proteinivorum]
MLLKRTHTCGELNGSHVGEQVTLNGWVNIRRDLGGVIFIDLRDRYGLTQVVFSPQDDEAAHLAADELRNEFVIGVSGKVQQRDPENINPKMKTGEIEVRVHALHIYSRAKTPPFEIKDDIQTNEETRLKYRYLDLRRAPLQQNLMLRSEVYRSTRNYFCENNFAEVETPVLMRSTPEGARDYLVPSRVNPGKFYALPQSPQIYKQTLMISGMDRYFQIVKCFRDEDLRADRQPEFTQIDVEMSFVDEESIYSMAEGLMARMLKDAMGKDISTPFPRMSYQHAIETYGSDKPDTRFDLTFRDLSEIVKDSEFRVFSKTVAEGGKVVGFVAPGYGSLGRGIMDRLTKRVQQEIGAGGLIYIKNNPNELYSSVSKFVSEETTRNMAEAAGAAEGDLVLILAGKAPLVYQQLGDLRLMFAKEYGLIDEQQTNFLWVTDFPLFEYSEEDGRYYAMHHPFTSPNPEDVPLMETEPGKVRARAYDLVLNGSEIGGGSIRIHDFETQQKMFRMLGIEDEEAREKFGFLLEAFQYGAPPHGGIAFGLDRIVMLLAGAKSLRDVIAFPKNQRAQSTMDNCPDSVETRQLDELYIQLKPILK